MLKNLLLRNKIDSKNKALENLRNKDNDFKKGEEELEAAVSEMDENTPEEDRKVIEEQAEQLDTEKEEHEKAKQELEKEIEELEVELKELEERQKDGVKDKRNKEYRGDNVVATRRPFFGMNTQERDAFFKRDDVKNFIENVRNTAVTAIQHGRGVSGTDLTIPTVVLDLIRENVTNYSKLINKVRLVNVAGVARQNVMGTIPEAIWTEMCASINEIEFGFSQTEVEGYKVGGLIYICTSTLEDSDLNLGAEIINALGVAIGTALDKAIIYGVGTKMPQGIVTRLAQTSAPSDYPAKSRPWVDLHESNMITISESKKGIEFFKEIVKAGGKAKSKYSKGDKIWLLNENTKTKIVVEAMNFNSAGALVSIQDNKMPVAGGEIIVLSDDIIPDDNIIVGYGDLYLLAERAGAVFARSDEYKFAEDLVAFKGTARYDGKPVIAEGFVAIGLGSAPVSSALFTGDKNNDASLQEVKLGDETLSPTFVANVYKYTVTTSNTGAIINAIPTQPNAKIEIKYNKKTVNNGTEVEFVSGTREMIITVKNGLSTLTYTISITKS